VKPVLLIGNKNYSSWSLRAWLALTHAGVEFDERMVWLDRLDTGDNIRKYSPSGRVPCLIDGDLTIWDSLAICETANERYVAGRLWPSEPAQRARARAVSAEMHSSFVALRTHMPMDIRSRLLERGAAAQQRADVAQDIARIQSLWSDCLGRSGGPFLFGDFSIADAMYAPVITRFATYGVALASPLADYSARIIGLPAMQRWSAAGADEPAIVQ
jgi:glutathione S-transferase